MNYAVEMLHISKRFGSVIANDDVSLKVEKATVHAIIGENGAGKTTLMNILYGIYQCDSGTIIINGQPKKLKSANDAIKSGIGMVHQHFTLIPRLSVSENVTLGMEPRKGLFFNKEEAISSVQLVSDKYSLNIDATAKVSNISLGSQQRVEIAKVLYRGAEILILDEPTAVLTPQEIESLGKTIKRLKNSGKTIIIITHKLDEVMSFSDIITVLRNGHHVITVDKKDIDVRALTTYMVGHELAKTPTKKPFTEAKTILTLEEINTSVEGRTNLKNINLELKEGEILGVAGIDKSGQTELTELLAGIIQSSSGKILFHGEDINNKTIEERKKLGIGFIPQDRINNGLVMDMTIEENLILGLQRRTAFIKNRFFTNSKAIHSNALSLINTYDIRPSDMSLKVINLSGGNQQKVIIARETSQSPSLIIADQPTRGVDIGAIEAIHGIFTNHRNNGGSVVMSSLELDEVLELCDRIVVMYSGRIIGILKAEDASREKIGYMMIGKTEEASCVD